MFKIQNFVQQDGGGLSHRSGIIANENRFQTTLQTMELMTAPLGASSELDPMTSKRLRLMRPGDWRAARLAPIPRPSASQRCH
jgi:hypothetical protein